MRPEATLIPITPEEAEALVQGLREDTTTPEQRRILARLEELFDALTPLPIGYRPEIVAFARTYMFEAINGLLEMSDYDGLVMPWPKADHEAVLQEVRGIRALFEPKYMERRYNGGDQELRAYLARLPAFQEAEKRRKVERRQTTGERAEGIKRDREPVIRRTKPTRRHR